MRGFAGLISLAFLAFPAQAAEPDLLATAKVIFSTMQVETLPNGLQVVLLPIPEAPTVTTMLAYRVGSGDEAKDQTGLSHYLEHLLFKGTDTKLPGDIDRLTQRHGGVNNAYTSEDMTVYFFNFSADRWMTALEIEADRMRNTRIDEKHEFQQEKGAVVAELKMYEDQPWDLEYKALLPRLFGPNDPYAHPVIGQEEHVRGATAEIITRYYDAWYHPNNATLIVVGGFAPAAALAKVRELFGSIPRADLPARRPEPPPTERSAQVRHEFESKFDVPRMLVGFNGVKAGDPDDYTLTVIAQLLSGGKTSRLYRKLVDREQLCSSVQADNNPGRYPGWFSLSMEMLEGKDRHQAERLLFAELERLANEPVPAAELAKVKRAILARQIFSRERVHSLANQIADAVMRKDLDYLTTYLDRIMAVGPEEIQRAARRWLKESSSVVIWSIPKPQPGEPSSTEPRGRQERFRVVPADRVRLANMQVEMSRGRQERFRQVPNPGGVSNHPLAAAYPLQAAACLPAAQPFGATDCLPAAQPFAVSHRLPVPQSWSVAQPFAAGDRFPVTQPLPVNHGLPAAQPLPENHRWPAAQRLITGQSLTVAHPLAAAQRLVLRNGMTVLLIENHRLPLVVAAAEVRDARLREPAAQAGVAALVGAMLDEGTAQRSNEEISEAIESVGGSLSYSLGRGTVQVLSSDLELGLSLLLEGLMQPSFPVERLEAIRAQILAEIQAEEAEPRRRAARRFAELVYGDHPYGRPINGRREIIEKLSPEDCKRFHQAVYVPNNTTLAIVGDFQSETLVRLLEKLTGNWQPVELAPLAVAAPPERDAPLEEILTDPSAAQTHIYLGHVGIRRNHPDYYALEVMDNVLGVGAGFTDRLSSTLRDRQGLAYTVRASITATAGEQPGAFTGYIGTFPDKYTWVRDGFLKEIHRIRDEPPTDEEVENAKQFLLGSLAFQFETAGQLTSQLLTAERLGLGLNWVEDFQARVRATTAAEVQAVARKHLQPGKMIVVAVGPINAEGKPLADLQKGDRE